jgi:hypothetical protein
MSSRATVCVLLLFTLLTACGGGGTDPSGGGTPPPVTLTLTAAPASVTSGQASTLRWNSTGANACNAGAAWSGSKPTSGSESTGPLTTSRTYQITCTGAGGSETRTTSVVVEASPPAPTLALTANPTTIVAGANATLSWTSSNATTCTASGGWSGNRPLSGSVSVSPGTTTTYILACTGASGSTNDSATVTVGSIAGPAFPLHTEAGKRYLVDSNGQPFFIHGDTPWCMITRMTREQVDLYLDDRKAKGINTLLVELIERSLCLNSPSNAYGNAPFTTAGDFATPNEAYFAHAEYVIAGARSRGMLMLITPAYMGFGGGCCEGWYDLMQVNGAAKMRAFGQYVAQRFRAYDNVIWVQGGDYNPPDLPLLRSVPLGIRDVDTKWLHTFHGSRGTSALGYLGGTESWLNVNNIYTDGNTVVQNAFVEYQRSTMPFFLIEASYEFESASETLVRTQAYQASLSGAMGHLYGGIWRFANGWEADLNPPGLASLRHLRTLIDSYAWWTLVPDTNNTMLTAGVGSGSSRAVGARSSAGAFAILYAPSVRALTVDLTGMSGPSVRARWFDPTSGAYTEASGSPFAASGSVTLTPTGSNGRGLGDWVLVLESVP